MAQPNVAREPSMEEILASIRRIIESNEPGQGADFAADQTYADDGQYDAAAELRSPPAHVPPPANQAFAQRQSAERSATAQQGPIGEAAEKTMSLADVAARVRAAADRNAQMAINGGRVEEPAPQLRTPQSSVPLAASAPQTASAGYYVDPVQRVPRPTDVRPLLGQAMPAQRDEGQARAVAAAERVVEPVLTNWNDVNLRQQPPSVPPVAAPQASEPSPAVQNAAAPRAPAIDIDEQRHDLEDNAPSAHSLSPLSANLLSEMAEQEIARSFDELQNLFNVDERPNVEDMTREMLRPMLKDWLEDNLPTIVERLVREEISRVVRGSKR